MHPFDLQARLDEILARLATIDTKTGCDTAAPSLAGDGGVSQSLSNALAELRYAVAEVKLAADSRSLPTPALETKFFELSNQIAELKNMILAVKETAESRSLASPTMETRFFELGNQIAEVRNMVIAVGLTAESRSLPTPTVEKQFAELTNKVLHTQQRIDHLANVLDTIQLEVRYIQSRPDVEPVDITQAKHAIGLAAQCWPPHRAFEAADADASWILQGFADVLARVVEHDTGTPKGAARTTTPLTTAPPSQPATVAIACATLDSGGAERQAALTAAGLVARGVPAVFIGFTPERRLEDQFHSPILVSRGVTLINAADGAAHIQDRPPSDSESHKLQARLDSLASGAEVRGFLEGYLRAFQQLRPQVVHTWLDYTNVAAGLAALWAGVPRVVLGLRNMNPTRLPFYQPFFRPMYRLILDDPRVVLIANSRAGAVDYARWLDIDPDRIHVVSNAFAEETFPAPSDRLPTGEVCNPVVLGVSQLRPEKDPLLFVSTCAEISSLAPEVHFALVGTGPLEAEARRLADDRGIADRFSFLGSRTDVLQCMRDASLLLHTARVEGLPNVFLEAQHAGLPIITTAVGGAAEAIDEGVTGISVATRCPKAIAAEVVRRLSDAAWLECARSRGPDWVRDRFSLDRMIEATLGMYGILVDEHAGNRSDG